MVEVVERLVLLLGSGFHQILQSLILLVLVHHGHLVKESLNIKTRLLSGLVRNCSLSVASATL